MSGRGNRDEKGDGGGVRELRSSPHQYRVRGEHVGEAVTLAGNQQHEPRDVMPERARRVMRRHKEDQITAAGREEQQQEVEARECVWCDSCVREPAGGRESVRILIYSII